MTAAPADDLTTEYTTEDKKFDFVVHGYIGDQPFVLSPVSPTARHGRITAQKFRQQLLDQGVPENMFSFGVHPVPEVDPPAGIREQQAADEQPADEQPDTAPDPAETFRLPAEPPVGSTVRHDLPVDDGARYTRGPDGWRSNGADWTIPETWGAILFLAARDAKAGLRLVADTRPHPSTDPLFTVRGRPGPNPVLAARTDGPEERPWRVIAGVRPGKQTRFAHDDVADWPIVPLDELAQRLGHPAAPTAAPQP